MCVRILQTVLSIRIAVRSCKCNNREIQQLSRITFIFTFYLGINEKLHHFRTVSLYLFLKNTVVV